MWLGSLCFSTHLPFHVSFYIGIKSLTVFPYFPFNICRLSSDVVSLIIMILVIYVFFSLFFLISLGKAILIASIFSETQLHICSSEKAAIQVGTPPSAAPWNLSLLQPRTHFVSHLWDHCALLSDVQNTENSSLIHLVQFLSCFRQEGKYGPCYSILPHKAEVFHFGNFKQFKNLLENSSEAR